MRTTPVARATICLLLRLSLRSYTGSTTVVAPGQPKNNTNPDLPTPLSTRLDELELLFPNDNASLRSHGKRSSSSGSNGSNGSYNDLGDVNTALAQQLREAEARRREAEREVAELQRVADMEKAKCDAETSVLPSHWTRQAEDGGDRSDLKWWHEGRCVVDVDEGCGEWQAVETLLNDSLPEVRLVPCMSCHNFR